MHNREDQFFRCCYLASGGFLAHYIIVGLMQHFHTCPLVRYSSTAEMEQILVSHCLLILNIHLVIGYQESWIHIVGILWILGMLLGSYS